MSWTSPKTWVTGSVVTASELNTHLRDNLLETASAKVTTAGDLAYATGANALGRLGIGSAGQHLTVSGSAPSWSTLSVVNADVSASAGIALSKLETQPYCEVTINTGRTLVNGVELTIDFDVEIFDDFGWHSNSTNSSRVTPSIAGRYLVIGTGGFNMDNSSGYREIKILKNGSANPVAKIAVPPVSSTSADTVINVSHVVYLNGTTDYIEMSAYQNAGVNMTLWNGSYRTSLIVIKLAGTG